MGGALELRRVVHLHQDIHAEVRRERRQLVELRVAKGGDDEEDAVRPQRARFIDLIGVDREVLAQHRQSARRSRLREMAIGALEERLVGEHRQGRRASRGVVVRDRVRVEVLAQHPLARRRLLQLRDHRGLSGRDAGAERRGESAGRSLRLGLLAEHPQRRALGPLGDLARLVADDAQEHVRTVPTHC